MLVVDAHRPGVGEGVAGPQSPIGPDSEVGVPARVSHLAAGVVGRLLHDLIDLDAEGGRDVDRAERMLRVDAELARQGTGGLPGPVLVDPADGVVAGLLPLRGLASVVADAGLDADVDIADGHDVVTEVEIETRPLTAGRPAVGLLDLGRAHAQAGVPARFLGRGRGGDAESEERASGDRRQDDRRTHWVSSPNGSRAKCPFHIHNTPYLIICQ